MDLIRAHCTEQRVINSPQIYEFLYSHRDECVSFRCVIRNTFHHSTGVTLLANPSLGVKTRKYLC